MLHITPTITSLHNGNTLHAPCEYIYMCVCTPTEVHAYVCVIDIDICMCVCVPTEGYTYASLIDCMYSYS